MQKKVTDTGVCKGTVTEDAVGQNADVDRTIEQA